MTPRRLRRWIIALVLVVAAAFAAPLAWPRNPSLMDRAVKVLSLSDQDPGDFFWLSDHELLTLRGKGNSVAVPIVFDTGAHVEKEAPELGSKVNDSALQRRRDDQRIQADVIAQKFHRTAAVTLNVGKHSIQLPPHTSASFYAISHDGKSIIWLLQPHDYGLTGWLRRISPGSHDPNNLDFEIWISRIDGAQMRLLGDIRISESFHHPLGLQFLPGDRRFSLRHNDGVYTIPVD